MEEINGKSAILAHLKSFYEDQQGFIIEESGQKPISVLDDVLVFRQGNHWHYITLGLTELYDKETSQIDISGFGIELTFRLLRQATDNQPPVWVKHFLQNLAAYVFESGQNFDVYEYLDAGGVICQDVATQLTAVAFVEDALLKNIVTPNGSVKFLQVIGLTAKEMEFFGTENYIQLIQTMQKGNPLLVTDLMRKSFI